MVPQPEPITVRPDEPELAVSYRKDPTEESFLARLNATLAGFEDEGYRDLPEELPTLHVIGAPRSGTTLLHQVVAGGLDVASVTNLVAAGNVLTTALSDAQLASLSIGSLLASMPQQTGSATTVAGSGGVSPVTTAPSSRM